MAEKRLTREIAEQFLADKGSVDLSRFMELDDAAADSLSRHKRYLSLTGLTSLPNAGGDPLSVAGIRGVTADCIPSNSGDRARHTPGRAAGHAQSAGTVRTTAPISAENVENQYGHGPQGDHGEFSQDWAGRR